VVGCGTMKISEVARTISFAGTVAHTFKEGDFISLNGATGEACFKTLNPHPSNLNAEC